MEDNTHKIAFSSSKPVVYTICSSTYSNVSFNVHIDICMSFGINQEKKILEDPLKASEFLCAPHSEIILQISYPAFFSDLKS